MKYRLAEFIWRRKNADDLWGGMVNALRKVSFSKLDGDEIDEEFVYTEVKRARDDLDHDDEEFEGARLEEESEGSDSSDDYQPLNNSHRKRQRTQ